MLSLDAKKTALVIIDLQKGIVSRPLAPHTAQVECCNVSLSEDELVAKVADVHVLGVRCVL